MRRTAFNSGFSGRQHGLRLDHSLELLVLSFDRIGGPRASAIGSRQSCEGEKPVAGSLQGVGDGAVLEPHLRMKALRRASISSSVVDHLVVRGDLVAQALWRVRAQSSSPITDGRRS
jgi:hypothetical protein